MSQVVKVIMSAQLPCLQFLLSKFWLTLLIFTDLISSSLLYSACNSDSFSLCCWSAHNEICWSAQRSLLPICSSREFLPVQSVRVYAQQTRGLWLSVSSQCLRLSEASPTHSKSSKAPDCWAQPRLGHRPLGCLGAPTFHLCRTKRQVVALEKGICSLI